MVWTNFQLATPPPDNTLACNSHYQHHWGQTLISKKRDVLGDSAVNKQGRGCLGGFTGVHQMELGVLPEKGWKAQCPASDRLLNYKGGTTGCGG